MKFFLTSCFALLLTVPASRHDSTTVEAPESEKNEVASFGRGSLGADDAPFPDSFAEARLRSDSVLHRGVYGHP